MRVSMRALGYGASIKNMSKKLALVLGTTILTVTLAVLGLAVWRVGDLRTVLERPSAAGNTVVIHGCKQTACLVEIGRAHV